MRVLCSISTKNRYDCLPMAIMSVAMQTRRPDHFVLYDDNDDSKRKDLRLDNTYLKLFQLLDDKGIAWHVEYGDRKGQHFNHQRANKSNYDFVWRLDDDCVAEPNVLELLLLQMKDGVGAVGGSILTPPVLPFTPSDASSLIGNLDKPNKQWFKFTKTEECDHLHCSFLYRAGIVDYDLRLSSKAHREETMFTYALKHKGYKVYITPCITWHLKSASGGIRSDNNMQDYQHDEQIFIQWLALTRSGRRLYVLNNGLGDHYMFRQAITTDTNDLLAVCYPEVFANSGAELTSIAEATGMTDITKYDVYRWCGEKQWKGTLIEAFREMYKDL